MKKVLLTLALVATASLSNAQVLRNNLLQRKPLLTKMYGVLYSVRKSLL